ncbi:hypothetical protein DFH27DRAFT_539352 [Peziza echinospora]|nr:hypothetical protein DFH27DRAFT_539352 [Peziza echinospora]
MHAPTYIFENRLRKILKKKKTQLYNIYTHFYRYRARGDVCMYVRVSEYLLTHSLYLSMDGLSSFRPHHQSNPINSSECSDITPSMAISINLNLTHNLNLNLNPNCKTLTHSLTTHSRRVERTHLKEPLPAAAPCARYQYSIPYLPRFLKPQLLFECRGLSKRKRKTSIHHNTCAWVGGLPARGFRKQGIRMYLEKKTVIWSTPPTHTEEMSWVA